MTSQPAPRHRAFLYGVGSILNLSGGQRGRVAPIAGYFDAADAYMDRAEPLLIELTASTRSEWNSWAAKSAKRRRVAGPIFSLLAAVLGCISLIAVTVLLLGANSVVGILLPGLMALIGSAVAIGVAEANATATSWRQIAAARRARWEAQDVARGGIGLRGNSSLSGYQQRDED